MHKKLVSQNDLVMNIKDAFSRTPVATRKAVKSVNSLLAYITNNKLSEQQYKNIYFYILRGLNTEDKYLKSTIYSAMTQLKTHTSDSFIAINSLTKDLNSDTQHIIKAKALMALFSLIPHSMINDFEKYVTQAFVSRFEPRRDSGVIICLLNIKENRENVKRWTMNINLIQGIPIKDYHTLAMLSYTKDRNSLEKICNDYKKYKGPSGVALVNILAHFSRDDVFAYSEMFNKMLKLNDECLSLETARAISKMDDPSIFMEAIIPLLKNYLKSTKKSIKFATMRIISALSGKSEKVKILNKEIEELVGNPNRALSMMAITTLLKTGTEETIERLVALIPGIINDMSDSFKVTVLSALESLSMRFKSKEIVFFEFIKNALNNKATLAFKRYIVKVMERISDTHPDLDEQILCIVCSYIEDSQNYLLTMDILALISKIIGNIDNYKKYIIHVFNRLIIDNNHIKCSALQALHNIALVKNEMRDQVTLVLNKYSEDEDEMISAESKFLLSNINKSKNDNFEKFCITELGDLREEVIAFLGEDYVIEQEKAQVETEKKVQKYLKTSQEFTLTEKNSDFALFVTKYIYSNVIILKFRVINMLENISFKKGKLCFACFVEGKSFEAEFDVDHFDGEIYIEKGLKINQDFIHSNTYDDEYEPFCKETIDINYTNSAKIHGKFVYELYADQDDNDTEIESINTIPFEINFIDFITPFLVTESDKHTKTVTLTIPGSVNVVRQKIIQIFNLKMNMEEFSPNYKMSCSGIIEDNRVVLCVKQVDINDYMFEITTNEPDILNKMMDKLCE